MNAVTSRNIFRSLTLAAVLATTTAPVLAHDSAPAPGMKPAPVPPAALAQLEEVRHAAARFFDPKAAEAAGYVDIGLDLPNMGLHYLNFDLISDGVFDPQRPEALVYQFDNMTGTFRLVAVEYVSPLTDRPPQGFIGPADQWGKFGDLFWTLHAWVYEYNPSGVFAPNNPRMP
jgi:hypothetical protein